MSYIDKLLEGVEVECKPFSEQFADLMDELQIPPFGHSDRRSGTETQADEQIPPFSRNDENQEMENGYMLGGKAAKHIPPLPKTASHSDRREETENQTDE